MVMVPEVVLRRRLTLEDYLALPDDQDYEIIDGVLYVAPPARSQHQVPANRLATSLTVHVEDRGRGIVVPDADLIVTDRDDYISPDIMVFLGNRFALVNPAEFIRVIPDLIVEVHSPSTQDYDRTTKRQTYQRLCVPHYWMADPIRRRMTECVLGDEGEYRERVINAPDPFTSTLFPDLTIDLQRLFSI